MKKLLEAIDISNFLCYYIIVQIVLYDLIRLRQLYVKMLTKVNTLQNFSHAYIEPQEP